MPLFLIFIIFNYHLHSTIIHSFILHHSPRPVFLFLMYLPTLLFSVTVHSTPRLFPEPSKLCCQAVLCIFPIPILFSAPTHSAVRYSRHFELLRQIFPWPCQLCCLVAIHSADMLSLYLYTLHLSDCPCTYPFCCQVSQHLPTLLSEFPCAYTLSCQVFLYLPTLLIGCPCINPVLIGCPCTYPRCCQIFPTHSAVRFSLPTLLSDFPYPLCCQIFPTHSAVRFPCNYPRCCHIFPLPTYSAVKFFHIRTYPLCFYIVPVPTHSTVRLLFWAPSLLCQNSLHLLTLLSGYSRHFKLCSKDIPCTYPLRTFPIRTKLLPGNSLHLQTLLSCLSLYLPRLLLGGPCTYPG
jgi:hypothetical protein